jgi:hypothetical protein
MGTPQSGEHMLKWFVFVFAVVIAAPQVAFARPKFNSGLPLSTYGNAQGSVFLGDIDGDTLDDYIGVAAQKLLVARTDFRQTGISHLYGYGSAAFDRIVVGDFAGLGRQQVCVLQFSHVMNCYVSTADGKQIVPTGSGYQYDAVFSNTDDLVVADFDGDGADDLLVHPQNAATVSIYSVHSESGPGFHPMANFDSGNLSSVNLAGKILFAGEFGQDSRADLLVLDPSNGDLYRFDGVPAGYGVVSFWWAWTAGGLVNSDEDVSVANVDDGATDAVVLHSHTTGAWRFFDTNLNPASGVDFSGLPQDPTSQVRWARLKSFSEPGSRRDDLLMYNDNGNVTAFHARWSGSQFVYWWAYTNGPLTTHHDWPLPYETKWKFIKCMFSDVQDPSPYSDDYIHRLFTSFGVGQQGIYDYFQDIFYGGIDQSTSEFDPDWHVMNVTKASGPARTAVVDACIAAANVDPSRYFRVVAVLNVAYDLGADERSNVLIDSPGLGKLVDIQHEMGHGHYLPHSFGAAGNEYGDWWDIMSAEDNEQVATPYFGNGGSRMNAGNLLIVDGAWHYLSPSRVLTLPGIANNQVTLDLASIGRPESPGYLIVKVSRPKNPGEWFTFEFRTKENWDANIPNATVLVHRQAYQSYLEVGVSSVGPEFTAGKTWHDSEGSPITMRVNSIDEVAGVANITITTRNF